MSSPAPARGDESDKGEPPGAQHDGTPVTGLASVAGALHEALRPWRVSVAFVEATGSTNADLMAGARAAEALTPPQLLVAARQTAGRGRLGRSWHGEAGASLTFSLAWPLGAVDASGLSLAVGVALAEALEAAPQRVALKWPNDLWIVDAPGAGRKLAGILIETTPSAAGRVAVIGIGINIVEQAVSEARTGVAWLREVDEAATPARTLLRVAPALLEALCAFERGGFAAFAERFAARDLLRGQRVRCTVSGRDDAALEGVATGVAPSGELLVSTDRGIVRVGSGEVSVRFANDAGAGSAPLTSKPAGVAC